MKLTPQEQLLKIEELATLKHGKQYRRDGITPYIKHVQAVVDRLHNIKGKIAGWGHYLIEDTDVTAQDLLDMGIDKDIVEAIVRVTKEEGYDYQQYMARINANPLAKAVKIADMRANLADTPTKTQIERYSDGILYLMT